MTLIRRPALRDSLVSGQTSGRSPAAPVAPWLDAGLRKGLSTGGEKGKSRKTAHEGSPQSPSAAKNIMNNTGEQYPIEKDEEILKIDSPRNSVSGPFAVVFKNLTERWAIVALEWDGDPRLGIRWFWGNGGNPLSTGHGTWLVVPPSLSKGMLASLPIDHAFSGKVDDFLCGKITGEELKS